MQMTREHTNCKGWHVFPTAEEASTGLKDVSHWKMMGMLSWRQRKHVVLTYLNSIVFAATHHLEVVIWWSKGKKNTEKQINRVLTTQKNQKGDDIKVDTEATLPKGLQRKPLLLLLLYYHYYHYYYHNY